MNKNNKLSIKEAINQLFAIIDPTNHIIDIVPPAMHELLFKNIHWAISILKTAEMAHNMNGAIDHQELYNALKPLLTDPAVIDSYNKWKNDISDMDAEMLKFKRIQVIIDVLNRGIMSFDRTPRNLELAKVSDDRISPWMSCEEEQTEPLRKEFAKLYRYLIIDGDMVFINRNKFGKYAMNHMKQFSYETTKSLFELEAVLDMVNDDLAAMYPKLQAVISKYRPHPKSLNTFAPAKLIMETIASPQLLKQVSYAKYTRAWFEQFTQQLLASPHGTMIAEEWNAGGKCIKIPAYVAGCLLKAGVYHGNMSSVARAIIDCRPIGVKPSSYSTYIGEGKKQPYLEWVLEYVKSN